MLTQERLKQLATYNPDTGEFIWKVGNLYKSSGEVAEDWISHKGYRYLKIDGKNYLDGRLAVLYMTGSFPEEGFQVDHENTIKTDCKWSNLRIAAKSQNQHNRPLNTNNTSGIKGVCWDKRHKVWQASVSFNKQRLYLGHYTSLEKAAEVVRAKREELHGNFVNHG